MRIVKTPAAAQKIVENGWNVRCFTWVDLEAGETILQYQYYLEDGKWWAEFKIKEADRKGE